MSLTPKKKRFCEEYLVDLNATQAAIRAGYSAKTANAAGGRLLMDVSVKAQIQAQMKLRSESTAVTADQVVKELAKIGFANMMDYIEINPDGSARVDLSKINRDMASAIQEVQTEEQTVLRGDDDEYKIRKIKFKLSDKRASLELLGRHLGMFKDKLEHSGGIVVKWVEPEASGDADED